MSRLVVIPVHHFESLSFRYNILYKLTDRFSSFEKQEVENTCIYLKKSNKEYQPCQDN